MDLESPFYGLVIGFVGDYAPANWLPYVKSSYKRSLYPGLAALYPTGSIADSFDLPGGDPPVSAGNVKGKVRLIIAAKEGLDPTAGEKAMVGKLYSGPLPDYGPMVGCVIETDAVTLPTEWAPCDGRLLKILHYQELFSIIGPAFGGDGANTFALPKIAPRASGKQYVIGLLGVYPLR
jgi:hypothetical protein